MATKFRLESCEFIGPITALEFAKTKLFVGEGAYLSAYETTNGNRITVERVFYHQRVHRIKVFDVNNPSSIVVCGGKAASFLHFQDSPTGSVISVISRILLSDWIWDICLFDATGNENLHVALATGHNAVWLWNVGENKKIKVAQCEEQCILYCARFIGHTLENLWLACGTVFNDVLLWKVVNKTSNNKVCKRLKGHDGVIFSITFDEERQILCSVSDDRSVKVWRLVLSDDNSANMLVEPFLVLYGHKARVWDCLTTQDYIITVGEDSTCLAWNSHGEIVKTFKGHVGKSIWSLAVDHDTQVLSTGGGDGGVRLWSLSELKKNIQQQHTFSTVSQKDTASQTNVNIPRSLGFLPNNNIIVMTDNGNFYSYNWLQDDSEKPQSETLDFLRNEPGFCSYSLMVLSPCRTIIALGNIHGNIKLLSATDPTWFPYEMKPYNDKVLSLHWLKCYESEKILNLFSCGPDGFITWWTVVCLEVKKVFSCDVKAYFRLPYCRQRWPNSIFIQPKEMVSLEKRHEQDKPLVLCGDRRGSLHIFKENKKEPVDPLHSHIGIHGRNGVTHITSHRGFVYTTGRDGYFRQYKFYGTNLELVDRRKVYKGLEWIVQLKFTSDGDTLVLGFHTIDFVIYSMQKNEILLRIPCGGGHRVWDFQCTESELEKTTLFTYLKKLTVHVHKLCENKITHSSILQESFHGRETTCVRFVGSLQYENKGRPEWLHFLATGSEDTNINIMAYNPTAASQKKLSKMFTCQGHVSSVRCMTLTRVMNAEEATPAAYDQFLLFSGGGRALLKCWSVSLKNMTWNKQNSISSKASSHPICTLLTELPHNIGHYRTKKVQHEVMEGAFCDIRFMSISVFWFPELMLSTKSHTSIYGVITGCSDGNIRLFVLDSNSKRFDLIFQCCWNDKCILCVGHIIHSSSSIRLVVYAADTAGRITLWDFTEQFTECISDFVEKNNEEMTDGQKQSLIPVEADIAGSNIADANNYVLKNSSSRPFSDTQSITGPFFVINVHQSGINAISLLRQDNGKYFCCTGGDDGALVFAVFDIEEKNKSLSLCGWKTLPVFDAHTSSVTGVKIFGNNHVLSCSVDQRLKHWIVNIDKDYQMYVTLNDCHFVDVADVQDIDVQCNGDGSYNIAICGVGLQTLIWKLV